MSLRHSPPVLRLLVHFVPFTVHVRFLSCGSMKDFLCARACVWRCVGALCSWTEECQRRCVSKLLLSGVGVAGSTRRLINTVLLRVGDNKKGEEGHVNKSVRRRERRSCSLTGLGGGGGV